MDSIHWETSVTKYTALLKGIDELIMNTERLVSSYESVNMDFAYRLYEEELTALMTKIGYMEDYEREFMLMYYSLKGQVENFKHYRNLLEVMAIKDPLNCPNN